METQQTELHNLQVALEQMIQELTLQGGYHVVALNACCELEAEELTADEFEEFMNGGHQPVFSSRVNWELCIVRPGELPQYLRTVDEAIGSREYFYTSREEVYGPEAWPLCR